jgi:hypothetical protein
MTPASAGPCAAVTDAEHSCRVQVARVIGCLHRQNTSTSSIVCQSQSLHVEVVQVQSTHVSFCMSLEAANVCTCSLCLASNAKYSSLLQCRCTISSSLEFPHSVLAAAGCHVAHPTYLAAPVVVSVTHSTHCPADVPSMLDSGTYTGPSGAPAAALSVDPASAAFRATGARSASGPDKWARDSCRFWTSGWNRDTPLTFTEDTGKLSST